MKINILLPTTHVYGGIRSVFEISNVLVEHGNSVTIVVPAIKTLPKDMPIEAAKKVLTYPQRKQEHSSVDWFDFKGDIVTVPHMIPTKYFADFFVPDADATIATWWKSAYYLNSYPSSKGEKFYFVQHFETHSGNANSVVQTYDLPLHQIVTSTWLKEKIGQFDGILQGQVLYGVNFDTFYNHGGDYEVEEPIRVGMMFSEREWKGNREGFQAFERVDNMTETPLELVLFGRERSTSVPEYAEFHENPDQDQLRDIYTSMDIFLMPSHHEGFGMPPMEAMACGTACIVTNVGGVPDYTIPGETAIVVEPQNVDELAEALHTLVREKDRIAELSKRGQDHIQQFTWEQCGSTFEEILESSV